MCKFKSRFFLALTFFSTFIINIKADDNRDYLYGPMPAQWMPEDTYFNTDPAQDRWWDTFNDTILVKLIDMAVKNNFNVSAAVKNIKMAQKTVQQAKSGYSPVFTADLGWTRSREAGAIRGQGFTSSYFNIGASMSWEIDVFGRVYENVKEKKAAYEVSKADYDAVMLSLCANLASSYLQLKVYQEELKVTLEHIESQKYICKITESRFNAQLASMLDVTQAKVVLYETESSLPNLKANIQTLKNAISILVGKYPGEIEDMLTEENGLPAIEHTVSVGVPANLLRRRPDIREAEMELAEYAAAIGIAKRDFFPTLSLAAEIGTYSNNIDGLFGKNSLGYSIEPTLSWTIFEGLSRDYVLAEAKLQFESAIDEYNLTVMSAVEEVENAMIDYSAYLEALELQKKVVDESKKSLDLSFELYKSGLTMFTNVVDSEINWLTSQTTLITMKGEALTSLVNIYKSLGGGWEVFPPEN